jgi:hypothetical protein
VITASRRWRFTALDHGNHSFDVRQAQLSVAIQHQNQFGENAIEVFEIAFAATQNDLTAAHDYARLKVFGDFVEMAVTLPQQLHAINTA